MRSTLYLFSVVVLAACGSKSDTHETAEISSSTGATSGAWAVGYFYRPGGGSPTAALATLDVKPDHTVELHVESCHGDQQTTRTIGWEPVDDDAIAFVAADSSGSDFFGVVDPDDPPVQMSRTDRNNIVLVTAGKVEDTTHGEYVRSSGPVCLVLKDPVGGCDNGTYAKPCT